MTEPILVTEEQAGAQGMSLHAPQAHGLDSLEQRVRRLEDVVATFHDTRQLENQVVERVVERLQNQTASPLRESAGLLMEASRRFFPLTKETVSQSASPDSPSLRQPWLVIDAYLEARAIWKMFFDSRFAMSWHARVFSMVLLGAILTSYIWFPGLTIISYGSATLATLVDKAVDLVLAFFAYKLLNRESRRYREMFPGDRWERR